MTAIELRAELFREMSPLLDSEAAMAKMLAYVRKLTAKKDDPTLMTEEEFFARVDRARESLKQGRGTRFSDPVAMKEWLNSL